MIFLYFISLPFVDVIKYITQHHELLCLYNISISFQMRNAVNHLTTEHVHILQLYFIVCIHTLMRTVELLNGSVMLETDNYIPGCILT